MAKKTIIATLALISVLAVNTGSAFAYMNGHNNGHNNGHWNGNSGSHGMQRGYHNGYDGETAVPTPELTEAQIANLDKLEDEYVAKVNPLRVELAAKSAEYDAIMSGTNPDPTKAGRAAAEITKITQELQELSREYVQKVEKETGITMGGRYHHRGYCNW